MIDRAAAVERSLDALAPLLAQLVADRCVSGESAMHIVVMDPAATANSTRFEDAILRERSFGDVASWQADYRWYAREKARVAWRERASLRDLIETRAERLRPGDIRVEGGVCAGDWVVAASGAQAWYDHAIATATIALVDAALRQARHMASERGQ